MKARIYFVCDIDYDVLSNALNKFASKEIEKHNILYFFQDLYNSTHIALKFKSQIDNHIKGNDLIYNYLESNAVKRHKQFCKYF